MDQAQEPRGEVAGHGVGRLPSGDREVPGFLAGLGLDGMVDIHVHVMPDRLQQAVWRYFDALDDPP